MVKAHEEPLQKRNTNDNIQMELMNIKEVQSKIILNRIYYQPSWRIIFELFKL